jgi:hypothetical protein
MISYDRVSIHQLTTNLEFRVGVGFTRFILGIHSTLEVRPLAKPDEPPDDDLSDLLGSHPDLVGSFAGVAESEAAAPAEPDNLVKWLEEILAEHGQLSTDLLESVQAEAEETDIVFDDDACVEDDIVSDQRPVVSYEDYLVSLGLVQTLRGTRAEFSRLGSARLIGTVHRLGTSSNSNLRATCKHGHGSCICWIQPRVPHTDDEVWRALAKWLADGANKSPTEHRASGDCAKRLFGMKPKRVA